MIVIVPQIVRKIMIEYTLWGRGCKTVNDRKSTWGRGCGPGRRVPGSWTWRRWGEAATPMVMMMCANILSEKFQPGTLRGKTSGSGSRQPC